MIVWKVRKQDLNLKLKEEVIKQLGVNKHKQINFGLINLIIYFS